MEKEQTTLGFEINYSGRVLFCEALLMVDSYAIFLNNKYMAEIEYDASAGWVQTNGVLLPGVTIEEIGAHIDGQLD
jgi:hypothetical protein